MPPRRVFPEEKVAELNTMLSAVVKSGTGRRADLGFAPQGGKTGTNQGYRDAWYIGYTGHYVTGVWFGNDDFTPMKEVTGGLLPAPTWKRIMVEAERGLQPVGLAGVPYDETYAAAAAELPGAAPSRCPATRRDQAAVRPRPPPRRGRGREHRAERHVRPVRGGTRPPPPWPRPRPRPRPARRSATQEALVLPKANVQPENRKKKRRLMEQIFGGNDDDDDRPSRSERRRRRKPCSTAFSDTGMRRFIWATVHISRAASPPAALSAYVLIQSGGRGARGRGHALAQPRRGHGGAERLLCARPLPARGQASPGARAIDRGHGGDRQRRPPPHRILRLQDRLDRPASAPGGASA